jgi:DNA-binding PadR family transcriptional regulator
MTAARRLTGEKLGPGTLYATLSRLEARGLIESLPSEDRRRPYRLTVAGVATLRTQLESIEGIVRDGLARLGQAGDSETTP